jgi:hypothetical protein
MSTFKRKRKKQEIRQHRQMVYEAVLDKVISGEKPPEYLRERFEKLKQVK